MKLNKQLNHMCAWLCIFQVCLLSFAAVSPQMHGWVFHGDALNDNTCSSRSVCPELPDVSEEHESQPNTSESNSEFCPVVLFEAGVILVDSSAAPLPERCKIAGFIEAEPERVWTNCLKGSVRSRAPPAG